MDDETVFRSFTASGLIPSDPWKGACHSRLKEKIFPDEPVLMATSDSEEELILEEGDALVFESDSADGECQFTVALLACNQ